MKMKKWLYRASLPAAIFVLAACSSTGEPTDGTVDTSDLTLEEVYNKAIERQTELKSVTANVTANQNILFDVDGETMEILSKTEMKMDTQMEPLAFFADGTIAMESNGESMDMPLQMYMTAADGFFVQDGSTETWMKLPAEMTDEMLAQIGTQGDASQQLTQLKKYISDFTFEQSNTEYILTLNADGEKFNDLILANAGSALEGLSMDEQQMLETMSFEDAVYTLTIDKETFETTKVDMDFVMKMAMEGQVSTIDTTSSSVFSNFNAVEPISVPKEVIEQAVDAQ